MNVHSTRLDALRAAVLAQGGVWTADRAANTVAHCPSEFPPTAGYGRELLKDLAAEGLLERHGQRWRWSLTPEGEQQRATVMIARRIANDLTECEQHGEPAATWYGYVRLADVRSLVDAVLNPGKVEPLPPRQERDVTERPVDVLRRTVLAEGGEWTARRAVEALDGCYQELREDRTFGGVAPTPYRARVELNKLVDEGLLVKHGKVGKLWTLTDEAERKRSEDPEPPTTLS